MAKKLTREQQWNRAVEEKIQSLRPTKSWLSAYAKEKNLAWDEEVNVNRAIHYLELAMLEMYSLQYHRDDEDKHRSIRAMDIE